MSAACVYLVGAGPGDAGLITVRGRELLRRADAVIYDYLAPSELLEEVPAYAERIYVGKKGFFAHISQDEINELLVSTAREVGERGGTCVVRLKGGDPFVFGRGGEEALALARAGVPFEIVSGVTSGVAAPAYAGIPVTHRGIASSVTFVTGHETPEKNETAIDWEALARLAQAGGTLCFYMGVRNLELIVGHLRAESLREDVPVGIVQEGTTAAQQTLLTTLGEAVAAAQVAGICAPAIIMVGEVARLREELSWAERRALFGKKLVVTRSHAQASGLTSELRELGASVMEFPTIAICEPDDFGPLDAALHKLDVYEWIIFTSVNGVDAFFNRLQGDARLLAGALVAAIGPATASRLAAYGIVADVVPSEYRAEALFAEIDASCVLSQAHVLIVRAAQAREVLPELLRNAGAQVDVVAAYKTVAPENADARALAHELSEGQIDGITFTSSSTVRNLISMLGDDAALLRQCILYSIGPVTGATLRERGYDNIVEAREYTISGLVNAIVEDCL